MQSTVEGKPTVIIVGGGYAGVQLAQDLEKDFDVTLIDRKPFFWHSSGVCRAIVDPSYVDQIMIPYTNALKKGRVLHAEVTKVSSSYVSLVPVNECETSEYNVGFDYLVIATGSSYPFPGKTVETSMQAVKEKFAAINTGLRNADHVTLIGSGPYACELAGEIKEAMPEKDVVIVCDREKMLDERLPNSFRRKAMNQLDRLGVSVLTGEAACLPEELVATSGGVLIGRRDVRTTSGKEIHTDAVFLCDGMKINSEPYADEFAEFMTADGELRVNEHLMVGQFAEIFAVGDCALPPNAGIKQARLAEKQATELAGIIRAVHSRPQRVPRARAHSKINEFHLPMGKKHGVVRKWGLNFGPWMAPHNLNTPQQRRKMGMPEA